MDITEIQGFDPKTCNFESNSQRLHNIERELNAKLDALKCNGLAGQEYVYLEDVLRLMGFSEDAIEGHIRIHGNCRWGQNGFERAVTEMITHWVKG